MRSTLETIPAGDAGLEHKVRRIRELVEAAKRDPRVRDVVSRLLAGVAGHDEDEEIEELVEWVRTHVRYQRDPWSKGGLEWFQTPMRLLVDAERGQAAGDCDDQVLLASTLLEVAGYPTRYRVGGLGPGTWAHIWLEVRHPSRGWIPAEMTMPELPLGYDPSARFPRTRTFDVPLVTIPRQGGRVSMVAEQRGIALNNYRGLLPSDLLRLEFLNNRDRMSAMDLALELNNGELAGFGSFFKKVGSALKKVGGYAQEALSYVGPVASLVPGVGPLIGTGFSAVSGLIGGGGSIFDRTFGTQTSTYLQQQVLPSIFGSKTAFNVPSVVTDLTSRISREITAISTKDFLNTPLFDPYLPMFGLSGCGRPVGCGFDYYDSGLLGFPYAKELTNAETNKYPEGNSAQGQSSIDRMTKATEVALEAHLVENRAGKYWPMVRDAKVPYAEMLASYPRDPKWLSKDWGNNPQGRLIPFAVAVEWHRIRSGNYAAADHDPTPGQEGWGFRALWTAKFLTNALNTVIQRAIATARSEEASTKAREDAEKAREKMIEEAKRRAEELERQKKAYEEEQERIRKAEEEFERAKRAGTKPPTSPVQPKLPPQTPYTPPWMRNYGQRDEEETRSSGSMGTVLIVGGIGLLALLLLRKRR